MDEDLEREKVVRNWVWKGGDMDGYYGDGQ